MLQGANYFGPESQHLLFGGANIFGRERMYLVLSANIFGPGRMIGCAADIRHRAHLQQSDSLLANIFGPGRIYLVQGK